MKKTKKQQIAGLLVDCHDGLTSCNLAKLSDQSSTGLRGRISELRKEGYIIEHVEVVQKVYVLKGIEGCDGFEWTAQQENFIKDNMFKHNAEWIAKKLNLAKNIVQEKLDTYGGVKPQ